ncbi:MAG: hypothetical protein PHW11_06135 [Anaerolineaceae bacterium]|jgi:hypothetical protein|nr:hypothetical protein [Anaerolineaceae bacterium]MDD4042144.1 hypothetical protein [Anaerolineaceae bacterium]MDD4578018.1 hypothetical protein [Anaerolineaceae bacterium]
MIRRATVKLSILVMISAVLAACVPITTAQETLPAITQTFDYGVEIDPATASPEPSPTPENTPVPSATATKEATATPKFTATPEATTIPEAMSQAEIRAEIRAAGVNLDDLANSKDEWTSSHVALETIQNSIDNLNFNTETENFVTTVVIGLEGVENLEELDQAVLTDGGWKLTSFAKLAYKSADGNWQIIKVPLNAYRAEDDLFWYKSTSNGSGHNFIDGKEVIQPDENGHLLIQFLRFWFLSCYKANYHYGLGSFIQLFTAWIEHPRWANNDGVLGDPPRYTEEQLIEFRRTGDPSIFGYQDRDGYPIFWPIVTFNADLSPLASYNQPNNPQPNFNEP